MPGFPNIPIQTQRKLSIEFIAEPDSNLRSGLAIYQEQER